ncbi:alpha/beta fold hydrolase [Streptomyces sp. SID9727]|uniref:thioesterase II family protein n=1 Tax=Streptomyces sp. SID9727 TaxID=2706114 RepID=UPI0013C645BB|nr:alpha/beta fold hydrolase [Streptomyces sp. SID9727]NEC63356.1 thioesterase [Streptomyces sp. SID9727]
MTTSGDNPWIGSRFGAVDRPRTRVVCLPQSGAGPAAFTAWRPHLPPGVEIATVTLPGRGPRTAEPLTPDPDTVTRRLLDGLRPELDVPYVLFGHSLGALLAHAVTVRAAREGAPAPAALVVSGSRAPHTPPGASVAEYDDRGLADWLTRIGGLPPELLRHGAYAAYVFRTVRADLALAERIVTAGPVRVGCPLHVFGGADDPLAPPALTEEWRACAGGAHSTTLLPGGHGFPQSEPAATVAALAGVLPVPVHPSQEGPPR